MYTRHTSQCLFSQKEMEPNLRLSDEELIAQFEFKRNPVMRFYKYLGETGGEWNYSAGVPLNYASTYSSAIPPNAGLGITLGWNYLDAVYAIGLGTLQLLDEEDYRQTQNKIKGVLNILSGVQLFLLSYNPYLTAFLGLSGGAALAAPSFAFAMACDLITATIHFYNSHKEIKLTGWLEERAQEIHHHEQCILKLNEQIHPLNNPKENDYLAAKKRSIQRKIHHIEEDIEIRSRVYCHTETGFDKNKCDKVISILNRYTPIHDASLPPCQAETLKMQRNKEWRKKMQTKASKNDMKRDQEIQQKLTQVHEENRINFAFKAASFVGMTLLAVSAFVVCSPLMITGMAITAAAAGFFIYKNSSKVINSLKKFNLFGASKNASEFILDDDGYMRLAFPAAR